jgi:ABC-2 type transport system ATP-binding protein
MTAALLKVDNIQKRYGRVEALHGVSFHVDQGELFGLLGPNGAGKTTLISILACLLPPTGGAATLGGKPILMSDPDIRRQIGIVPQDLAVYGELTARENLAFFGQLYGMPAADLDRRIGEVLEAIALADRADDRVNTYSGGMKRRLNLGVAILHGPKLLFLDEPTTGVDPQSRNRIFEEVKRLNSIGMTIVYTSHYMEEVQALCTRVGILDHGKFIACDTLQKLLHSVEGRIRFRVPGLPKDAAVRFAALPSVKVQSNGGDSFELRCPEPAKTLVQLVHLFREMDVEPNQLETHEPNLERVFLDLTGRALRD